MAKIISYNRTGTTKIPNEKPVLYEIKTEAGRTNYVGIAQRGRGQDRVQEHLPGAKEPVPGAKVRVTEFATVAEAREAERKLISRVQPKYNVHHR